MCVQEVASPEEDNNKKGLVLASLVILLILATVALNILIFSEEEEPQPELGQRLLQRRIFSGLLVFHGRLSINIAGFKFPTFSTHRASSSPPSMDPGFLVKCQDSK